MSHFTEAKYKLEQILNKTDNTPCLRILRIMTRYLQQTAVYFAESHSHFENNEKTLLNSVVRKCLELFDLRETWVPTEGQIRKVETYEALLKIQSPSQPINESKIEQQLEDFLNVKVLQSAIDNLPDFIMWIENLLSEIHSQNPNYQTNNFAIYKSALRRDLRGASVWKDKLEEVEKQISKADQFELQVQELKNEIADAQESSKEKTRALAEAKKFKLGAERKMRELQIRANKLPTLELEIKNLKDKVFRAEKSREIIAEKLKEKQNTELRDRQATESSIPRNPNDSFHGHHNVSMSMDKPLVGKTSVFRNNHETRTEINYDFKTKTEIKSLRGLVGHLNKEVSRLKSKNIGHRLFEFRKKAPTFEKINKMYNSGVRFANSGLDALTEGKKKNIGGKNKGSENPLADLLMSGIEKVTGKNELEVLNEESDGFSVNEGNSSNSLLFVKEY